MKYIIKNCPAIWENFEKNKDCCTYTDNPNINKCFCEKITDCLLKRIVEKCKFQILEMDDEIRNGNYPDKYKFFKTGRADAGKEILELLEIEEC